ncbi:MAG: transcription-repair coupling factor, partial [Prolixibacteraceae bacterium]|nr:transcription-repair coupling factor [Prolixibacteraceae bacterium]
MEAVEFLKYFEGQVQFPELVKSLDTPPGGKILLQNLIGSSKSTLLANLFQKIKKNIIILLTDREEAAYFFDDLNNLGFKEQTLFFPPSFKRSIQYGQPEQDNIVLRAEVLNKLSDEKQNYFVVTYPEALVEKVITRKDLESNTLQLSKGDKISISFINEFLFEFGFERVDFVYEPGQFSIRGSIVDVFSFSNEDPYRIDFFGDEVDSIRSFNIDNQISKSLHQKITIVPNIQQNTSKDKSFSFIEFLSGDDIIAGNNMTLFIEQVNSIYRHSLVSENDLSDELTELVVSGDYIDSKLDRFTILELGYNSFLKPDQIFEFQTSKQPVFNKNFDLLGENLTNCKDSGYRIIILSTQEKQIERLQDIFHDTGLKIEFKPGSFILHEGFIDHDLMLCCYTDHQIFERYHHFNLRSRKAQRETVSLKELNKLHQGDYVVHVDHGIGRFAGLVKTEANGKIQEAIRLVYKDNDSLLVSIHSLHRISKYKGKDGTEPSLNKLGTGAWERLKSRTKSKVKDIARELIALYAQRKAEKGFAFTVDSYLQNELEASFIYEDTPDQQKATISVKEDMEKSIPMDRLVCGDVGFGKT